MRKTFVAIAVAATLGLSACGTSNDSATPTTAGKQSGNGQPAHSTPPKPKGSDIPCPTQADFQKAVDTLEATAAKARNMSPQPGKLRFFSEIACKDNQAASWVTIQLPGAAEGEKLIMVLRWRYWLLRNDPTRSDADKRWEVSNYSAKFYGAEEQCQDAPIIDWLREQGSCLQELPS